MDDEMRSGTGAVECGIYRGCAFLQPYELGAVISLGPPGNG